MQDFEIAETKGMKNLTLEKLEDLFDTKLGREPFPTEEMNRVGLGPGYPQFHARLTLFLADIAGIASRGRRLPRISTEDRTRFLEIARVSFFDKYPEYGGIEKHITESAPDLLKLLQATEQARLLILDVLSAAPS